MVTIIFKTLEKCISNCIYCDVIKRKQTKVMTYDLLETVFIKINRFLEDNKGERVCVTWHGGEITLLGEAYFLKAYEFQNKHCPTTKDRIEHSAQSNLLVLNQGLIDALKLLGINSIGTSFDPVSGVRGIGKNRDSDLYNERFFNATKLLAKNNMTWGIINVVHKKQLNAPAEIYNYLTNLSDTVCFNSIYVYGEDVHDLRITGEEFADFLGAIFPLWLKHKDKINVRPFNDLYDFALNQQGKLVCEVAGNCTNRWMYIGPTGETSHCGKMGDYDLVSYGNIKDVEINEVINDLKRKQFIERLSILKEGECKDCRFWRICHGGCMVDSIMSNGNKNTVGLSCIWTKRFMENYLEPILNVRVDFSDKYIS